MDKIVYIEKPVERVVEKVIDNRHEVEHLHDEISEHKKHSALKHSQMMSIEDECRKLRARVEYLEKNPKIVEKVIEVHTENKETIHRYEREISELRYKCTEWESKYNSIKYFE